MIDLTKYKNPLLVIGHGVRISGAIEELHLLLDKINVPVVTTFNGFDIIASDHPNFVGRIGTLGSFEGNKALREADIVIFLGTRNNIRQVSYKWGNFAKNAERIVIVDIDEQEFWKPTIIDIDKGYQMSPEGLINDKFDLRRYDVKDFIQRWINEIQT